MSNECTKKLIEIFPIDMVFFTLLICWAIGLVAGLRLRIKFPKPRKPENGEDDVRYIAEKARNSWLIVCWVWQSVYYLMIIGSFVCTIIVLYISCYMDINKDAAIGRIFIYSAFSIIFGIVPYIIDFKKISSAYHAAHRLVNESLLKNGDIAEALIMGEELIREAFDGTDPSVGPLSGLKKK